MQFLSQEQPMLFEKHQPGTWLLVSTPAITKQHLGKSVKENPPPKLKSPGELHGQRALFPEGVAEGVWLGAPCWGKYIHTIWYSTGPCIQGTSHNPEGKTPSSHHRGLEASAVVFAGKDHLGGSVYSGIV